jgi:hypothetical protein
LCSVGICRERRFADCWPEARNPDDNPIETIELPTWAGTQRDQGLVPGSRSRDEGPSKVKALLAPTGVPSTFTASSRQRSLSAPHVLSIPTVDSASPEQRDVLALGVLRAPGLQHKEAPFLTSTPADSLQVPLKAASSAERKRPIQRTRDVAEIEPWTLPNSICYVPYEGSQRDERMTVDLVLVYMYRGEHSTRAHIEFFERPKLGLEPNTQRGKTRAILAASGKDIELQLMPPAAPPQPTKFSASEIAPNWLNDPSMLPEVIPHNRTICMGYDLDTVPDPNSINYEQATLKLFEKLDERRRSCSTRPIIFIGHGLGCLVVQHAFQRRTGNAVAESIQKACAGILYHHVPVEESGLNGSNFVPAMERIGSNVIPATGTFKSTPAPEQKSLKLDITKTAREHSILHHVLRYGTSEKDHTHSFKFSTKNDIEFQQLSAKIVEWSETHQLIRAVTQAEFATVQRLIDEGVKINLRKTLFEETALHVACQMHSFKSQHIDLLVGLGKADVTLKDSLGRTPLHYALLRESPDVEVVRVLLEAGDDIMVPDCDHITPKDQARKTAPRRVQNLLRRRPLIKGPSAAKGAVTYALPHSNSAGDVCDAYQMVATEMYFDSQTRTEKHLPRHFSISDAIYGTKSLQNLLDDSRSKDIKDELVCRWYHLPANNMAWVEDLFQNQFKMHPTIWSEQVRDSEWPHGRCIIPHTTQFTTESGESMLAICMPYVSYEDNYRQRSVSDAVRRQVPSTQTRWPGILKSELFQMQGYFDPLNALGVLPNLPQQTDTTTPSTPRHRRHSSENGPLSDGPGSDRPNSAQSRSRGTSPVLAYDSDDDSDAGASGGGPSQAAANRLSKEEEKLVRVYLHHSPPLHMRRTLDQYYYYMLEDTRERDADQVVTRWAERRLGKAHHNILMVDQLWIWVIKGSGGQSDRVVSCFPERQGHGSGFLDDLQRNVLNHNTDKRQPIKSADDLVARIVLTCSDIFGWSQGSELVRFLHFLEATVGRLGDVEIKLLNNFGKSSESLHHLDDNHFQYAKEKDNMLIEMLDIREQVKLLKEAKDIRDEISIIMHVLSEQRRVLEDDVILSFFRPIKNDAPDIDVFRPWREPLRVIKRAIDDFKRMDKQLEGIVDDLHHLLDLRQKQATVWEARSTRESARATIRQSRITTIFAIVTIIFLPLSFCASFFAIDIAEFPVDANGRTNWPLRRLCAYVFGASFAVVIPVIIIAMNTQRVVAAYNHFDEKWLLPLTIFFLKALSELPYMKRLCSTAVDGVERHRSHTYGMPYAAEPKPTPRLKSHSLATGVLLLGLGRRDASRSSLKSTCSGLDSEPRAQRSPIFAGWMKKRRERKRKPADEDV